MNTPETTRVMQPVTPDLPKRVYSAPRLTVHGTLAGLTASNPPDAPSISGPIGG